MMGYAQELEGPFDFSHCIHDLHHKQSDTGEWRTMGWKARGPAPKRAPTSNASDASHKQWDQPSSIRPRELEAWELWYLNDRDLDAIASEMGIKASSIIGVSRPFK